MGRLNATSLLPLAYSQRVEAVLAAMGEIEGGRSAESATETGQEPALCLVEPGIWALELWHTPDLGLSPTAWPLWQAYLAQGRAEDKPDIQVYLWLADLASAYCDMVADGLVVMGAPINVFADSRHPAFAAAVIAQQEGLPIYTVVGTKRDNDLRHTKGKALLWPALAPFIGKKTFDTALPDVLFGECEEAEAADVIMSVLDDSGYLMHPMTAKACMLAETYRQEAESRNPCLVIAPFHPYAAWDKLCLWLTEAKASTLAKGLARLELETGWAIPAALADEQTAGDIIKSIEQQYGD